MNAQSVHPAYDLTADLLLDLVELAVESTRESRRRAARKKSRTRPGPGSTRRPGPDTPLWNALVKRLQPHLTVRGTKAKLGRELDLPRQRVHEMVKARSAMPDAERALHLLCWLAARERGEEFCI